MGDIGDDPGDETGVMHEGLEPDGETVETGLGLGFDIHRLPNSIITRILNFYIQRMYDEPGGIGDRNRADTSMLRATLAQLADEINHAHQRWESTFDLRYQLFGVPSQQMRNQRRETMQEGEELSRQRDATQRRLSDFLREARQNLMIYGRARHNHPQFRDFEN